MVNEIRKSETPVNKARFPDGCEILGHIATRNKSTQATIDDRVENADISRGGGRNTCITNKEIDTELGLQFTDALIASILLRILHFILVSENDYRNYSKCVRLATEWNFYENRDIINNN